MSSFLLEIVTPERIVYSDQVEMVVVPSSLGTAGILPRHVPLFSLLVHGELKIKKDSEEYYLSIGGGFVEVTREKVMVLVTRAVKAQELEEQEILRAKKEAEEALKTKSGPEAWISAQTILRQSLVDLRILRRRKKTFHN